MAGKNRFSFSVILLMVILLILPFQIGAESLDDLVENLTHEDSQVRREAAQEIAKIGSEAVEALPALEKAIVDENNRVRWAAANALTAIGEEAVTVLSKALSAEL